MSVLESLTRDLEAPIEARGFGTGWFSGFFALFLAVVGFGMVLALRFPAWLGTPELLGARMHFFEVAVLRGVTALPMMTLGFAPPALQVYIGIVYVYASLVHANLRGDFDRLGRLLVTPRFHHWHHGAEREAIDVNFAIHFPFLDKVFGTYHFPPGRWPGLYGVEGHPVPRGYLAQFLYPFRSR
jgi:sterol desaturase/sphingolipid hydroxylase (fatty acid hydroxylase superfamily)